MTAKTALSKGMKSEVKEIQQAYAKGHKTVVLHGITYRLALKTKMASFTTNKEVKKQIEKWIIVTRADGKLFPRYNVEMKPQGNMRTVRVK